MRRFQQSLLVALSLVLLAGCAGGRGTGTPGAPIAPGTYEGGGLRLVLHPDSTFLLSAATPSGVEKLGSEEVEGVWNLFGDRVLAVGGPGTPSPEPQRLTETYSTGRHRGLWVRVVDDSTGAPVEGAIVALSSSTRLREPYTETDAEGAAYIGTRDNDRLLVRSLGHFERHFALASPETDSVVVPVVPDPSWWDIHGEPMLRLHLFGRAGGIEIYTADDPYYLDGDAGLDRLTTSPLRRVE